VGRVPRGRQHGVAFDHGRAPAADIFNVVYQVVQCVQKILAIVVCQPAFRQLCQAASVGRNLASQRGIASRKRAPVRPRRGHKRGLPARVRTQLAGVRQHSGGLRVWLSSELATLGLDESTVGTAERPALARGVGPAHNPSATTGRCHLADVTHPSRIHCASGFEA
jgi:hypothetical protein